MFSEPSLPVSISSSFLLSLSLSPSLWCIWVIFRVPFADGDENDRRERQPDDDERRQTSCETWQELKLKKKMTQGFGDVDAGVELTSEETGKKRMTMLMAKRMTTLRTETGNVAGSWKSCWHFLLTLLLQLRLQQQTCSCVCYCYFWRKEAKDEMNEISEITLALVR